MIRLVVLMYHALYLGRAGLEAIDTPDRPYAVDANIFAAQVDAIIASGMRIADPGTLLGEDWADSVGHYVAITFDDGHASGCHFALPILQDRGLRAAYFVTSDFVGRRAGYCNATDLRSLAAAGMTIGAHGRTHRFLSDLTRREATGELRYAKMALEDACGSPVNQVSFPGGRYRVDQLDEWCGLGYSLFHSSRIGVVDASSLHVGTVLPRIAIRSRHDVDDVLLMARAPSTWLAQARALDAAKRIARCAIGNRLYHALYKRANG